jgi:hypothetical protein
VLATIIHEAMRIIRGLQLTAADIPLCTEIIMAKGRIIIITIMVRIGSIFLIATVMNNTVYCIVGIRIIQNIGISISIISLREGTIKPLNTQTTSDMRVATIGIIILTTKTIIDGGVTDNPVSKFSMAILRISLYNASLSR